MHRPDHRRTFAHRGSRSLCRTPADAIDLEQAQAGWFRTATALARVRPSSLSGGPHEAMHIPEDESDIIERGARSPPPRIQPGVRGTEAL
jgi:hypothetical protein